MFENFEADRLSDGRGLYGGLSLSEHGRSDRGHAFSAGVSAPYGGYRSLHTTPQSGWRKLFLSLKKNIPTVR